jgi:hypothetical protein
MVERLHVSVEVRNPAEEGLIYLPNSNETLRLQPPVPSGSGRILGKGKGAKMLGKW